jgi:hypothetical protein
MRVFLGPDRFESARIAELRILADLSSSVSVDAMISS